MISAVVPVYNNIQITDDFFMTICTNTILPKEIILIDNGSTDNYYKLIKKYKNLNINYIRKDKNEGVNSAWNDGMRLSKTEYISILNNDLLLNKYFFQKIIEVLDNYPSVGIVIPSIIKATNPNLIHKSKDIKINIKDLKKRNGCAFTIRKTFVEKIEPIPEVLKTYCGDDYLFQQSLELGYRNVVMKNNFIFHYGGKTVAKVFSRKTNPSTRIEEKNILKKIL